VSSFSLICCGTFLRNNPIYCFYSHLFVSTAFTKESSETLLLLCQEPCESLLSCDHTCSGKCGTCLQGRLHKPCSKKCGRQLVCGHVCEEGCSVICPPCKEKCQFKCPHSKCNMQCGQACAPCAVIILFLILFKLKTFGCELILCLNHYVLAFW
jgi:hypothetical protein